MSDILLSFVVPCYNVEKYVQRCLDSIYACNLPKEQYEVICINDCSPDNVQEILERNREKHGNLRVIVHEKNKGLGGARNTGIREAKGKYLWFVDSDDDIMGDCLKEVLDKTCGQNLDIMCFNYRRVDSVGNEMPVQYYMKDIYVQDGVSFSKTAFEGGLALNMGFVWRFLYKTEFLRLQGLLFPEKVCWEDTVFMPQALLEAGRVAAVSDVLYSYRVNVDSISGTFSQVYPAKLIFEFAFCAGGDLLRFSEKLKDEELRNEFRRAAINRYINGFPLFLFRTNKKERIEFQEIVNSRKDEVRTLKKNMKALSKLLLLPVLGSFFAGMGALVYKTTHKRH